MKKLLPPLIQAAKTVPYTLVIAVTALPLLQRFAHLTWDEATTALVVPIFITYVFLRIFVRQEVVIESSKPEEQYEPIPHDMGLAIVLCLIVAAGGLLLLLSVPVYMLLRMPFAWSALRFDWKLLKTCICLIAYVGGSACIRWGMPWIRHQVSSLAIFLVSISGPLPSSLIRVRQRS